MRVCACVWSVPVWDDKMTALISPSPPMNRHSWLWCVCMCMYCMCVLYCTCSTWIKCEWKSKTCHKHVWLKLLISLTHHHLMLFKRWKSEIEVSVNKCVVPSFQDITVDWSLWAFISWTTKASKTSMFQTTYYEFVPIGIKKAGLKIRK